MSEKQTVKLYSFEVILNGERFEGRIPAYNWSCAEACVNAFDGVITGELVEERSVNLCAVCAGETSVVNLEHPQPVTGAMDDDWQEDFS